MKTCIRCGLPFDPPRCKPCANAAQAKRYVDNKEKYRGRSADWRAINPAKVKEMSKTYAAKNSAAIKESKAKYRAGNQEKVKAYASEWVKKNKIKKSAYNSAYRKAHVARIKDREAKRRSEQPEIGRIHCRNRKARKIGVGGTLSKNIAAKLFKLQKGKCPCCRLPLGDSYHLDHIVPLVGGGTNTDDNVQLLRAGCNLEKARKHPVEFMQSRGFLL